MRYLLSLTSSLLLVCLLVSGCVTRSAIYQDVEASRKASYEAWLQASAREGKAEPAVAGDLSLDAALDLALRNNRDIQAAVEGQMRARGLLWQGYSETLPKLTGTGSYRRLDQTPQSTTAGRTVVLGDKDNFALGLTLSQPLFHGGGIVASINAAELFGFMADEQLRATVEQILYAAAHAYFDAQLAQRLYEVNRDALASAEAHLQDVHKKKDAGLATQMDVLRAEVEVANVRADMIKQGNLNSLAKAALLKIIGVSQQSNVTLTAPLEYRPIKPVLEAAVKSAYEKRAGLYVAELDIRVQQEALALARSRYFPIVDAFFTQVWSKPDPHVPSDISWGRQWYAGIGASWLILDGFSRRGQIVEQEAILRQKKLQLADMEQKTLLEIQQALLNLRDAEQLVETQALNVDRAREGLRLATVGFPEVTTEVEVTDARSALVRAGGLHWKALYDHSIARLDLQRAMGLLAAAPGEQEVPKSAPKAAEVAPFAKQPLLSPTTEGSNP